MTASRRRRPRAVTAATAMVCAAALVVPSSALAVSSSGTTVVTGAALDTLGLVVATPASVLQPIQPGSTATSAGVVTVNSTSTGTWTLTVNDQSTAATSGQPVAGSTGCSGSAATLPALTVVGNGTGVTSSGSVTLSKTAQPIATGPTGLFAVTTNFSDVIPASTVLVNGCAYSLTAVFTASAS